MYWTRVPLENVDRIELVDGTSSSLYGNYAMGGVINVIRARGRAAARSELRTQYGNQNSPKADFVASDVWGKFGVAFDGSAFKTDGFPIVIENERGLVDNKANGRLPELQRCSADYSPTVALSVFVRGGYFQRGARQRQDHRRSTAPEANDTTGSP